MSDAMHRYKNIGKKGGPEIPPFQKKEMTICVPN